jgi:hypothetical protein
MLYGVKKPDALPQQDADLVRILADRWFRSKSAHDTWAEEAKICVDFREGRQWTEAQKAQLAKDKRPWLTLNRINSLVNLVIGYQENNKTDVSFLPSNDGASSESVAELLSDVFKNEAGRMDLTAADMEVFSDGMVGGRGYWDMRLDFEDNDLGETKVSAVDPFSVFIDPDHQDYDLTKSSHLTVSRWTSLDEVVHNYGMAAYNELKNKVNFNNTGYSYSNAYQNDDIVSPVTKFGMTVGDSQMNWRDFYNNELIDTYRKSLRLIDTQYTITKIMSCFIDLETGDKQPIPENWSEERIHKCLAYAKSLNNPMTVAQRPVRRIRWSVMCGDTIIYDKWSIYDSYTIVGFFPYFRRGITRGIVADLLDPQREINKKRSSITDILSRNANSGWIYHENSMNPEQKANIKQYGARPGVNIEWKGDPAFKPERLQPGGYPQGLDRLEDKSADDIFKISGINESAFGQVDTVQSGRAIEAKQRQAVIALQPNLSNFTRSKKLQGRKALELFQRHYTEQRIFRIIGEDGHIVQKIVNQMQIDPSGNSSPIKRILNDITVGKYQVTVNETPMSANFQEAQFQEALMLLQKMGPVGMALIQSRPDLLVSMSSLPRKEEWIQAIKQIIQQQQAQQQNMAALEAAQQQGGGQAQQQLAPPSGSGEEQALGVA